MEYEEMSLVQLKDLAKAKGLKKTALLRKNELIDLLKENGVSASEAVSEDAQPVEKKKRGRPRKNVAENVDNGSEEIPRNISENLLENKSEEGLVNKPEESPAEISKEPVRRVGRPRKTAVPSAGGEKEKEPSKPGRKPKKAEQGTGSDVEKNNPQGKETKTKETKGNTAEAKKPEASEPEGKETETKETEAKVAEGNEVQGKETETKESIGNAPSANAPVQGSMQRPYQRPDYQNRYSGNNYTQNRDYKPYRQDYGRGSYQNNRPAYNRENSGPGYNRPDYRSDNRADYRPDYRSENRPDYRSENRPDYRSENRPDYRSDNRPDYRSENRPDYRSENRPDYRSENRPDYRSDNRPDYRSENRPDYRSENRPDYRSENRPDYRSENRPDYRSENRPDYRTENRPDYRTENRPEYGRSEYNRPDYNRPDYRPENRPEYNRPDNRSDYTGPDNRPAESRPAIEIRFDNRPEPKTEAAKTEYNKEQPNTEPITPGGNRPEPVKTEEGQPETATNKATPGKIEDYMIDARTGIPTDMSELDSGETKEGILEIMPEGYAFIRCDNYLPGDNDVYVSPAQIRRFNLKTGDIIVGNTRIRNQNEKFSALLYVKSVNGFHLTEAQKRKKFEDLTPIFPNERIYMETEGCSTTMRMIDIFAPIGKGQRGMIVSPPKAGKTTILKQIAGSITQNYPDMNLLILLIDERPEEVTDIKESITGENVEVIYSTFDELPENHKRVSEMVIERAKRLVEHKKDVVILLDSITRLARAYNLTVQPSGRTLSGGLDPAALYMPKRFFGAARNMREGGSLTVLATALVDTGSRMDDVVYEEFKGTGNMEIVLNRDLSEKRIFPALDLPKSSTRREDLLLEPIYLESSNVMRRWLNGQKPEEALEHIINIFGKTKTNSDFVKMLITTKTPEKLI